MEKLYYVSVDMAHNFFVEKGIVDIKERTLGGGFALEPSSGVGNISYVGELGHVLERNRCWIVFSDSPEKAVSVMKSHLAGEVLKAEQTVRRLVSASESL